MAIFYHLIRKLSRPSPYRGALIHVGFKRFEMTLFAVLWAGITALGGFACQQMCKFMAGSAQHDSLRKSSPPSVPLPMRVPANSLPILKVGEAPSMFHLNDTETLAPPVMHPKQEAKKLPGLNAQPLTRNSIWRLEIQHSAVNEWQLAQQLAHAQAQLQAGRLEQARQAFEHILAQDPHQVVALAGMLVVMNGHASQKEDYLTRLHQEIPDYVPDDDLAGLQGD
jgi:hypothetical protein